MSTPVRLGAVDLLTVGEVAARLRVSGETVRRLIRRGELRAHAVGSVYGVTRAALTAYLEGSSTTVPPAADGRDA